MVFHNFGETPLPPKTKSLPFKDPVSGFTHLLGAVLSVWGLIALLRHAANYGGARYLLAAAIFGASLILLYSASAVYHLLLVPEKATMILRRIDHMMIYILIAGTYTPICLIALQGKWGTALLVAVWILAFTGILLKLLWFSAPRWLSTLFYLIIGWLIIVAIFPLTRVVPAIAISWLVIGGVLYTLGAVIYASKWPRISSRIFGFHEIFHLFVMGGSLSHFWLIFRYVMVL